MSCSSKFKEHLMQAGRRLVINLFTCLCLLFLLLALPAQAQDRGIENLKQTGKAFASVAKKISPAVVFIETETMVESQPQFEFFSPFGEDWDQFGDDFFRHFFGEPRRFHRSPRRQQRVVGQGSGFIISRDGYILTNNHVVGDADQVKVTLIDGREFKARKIGSDPRSDVAVIKIDTQNLPTLPLGDSDDLEVGEWVIAVGNPFGLSHTLTAGIVSAKGRSGVGITDYEDFIQTDAAINPGNSGGPLVDLNGEAVGINTAIFTRSGGYMGIGFAIPINMAKNIQKQLIEHGTVTRGYLGIVIQDLTPELAKSFGLDDRKGILVAQVTEGSPAEKAGLRQGDVIIEFDGKEVGKTGEFRNRVSRERPGEKAKIKVLRNGREKKLTVTLGKLPEKELVASAPARSLDQLGLTVKDLTRDLVERFRLQGETGVVVTQVEPDSIADQANIKPGSLIQEVNRNRVRNTQEFNRAVERTPARGTVLLLVKEGQYSRYVALRLEGN